MDNQIILKKFNTVKYSKLSISIFLDGVGMLSYFIPAIGEFGDILLAPITSSAIFMLYGRDVKWAAINLTEELLPFTDIVPSATLAWYEHFVKNEHIELQKLIEQENKKNQTIDSYKLK